MSNEPPDDELIRAVAGGDLAPFEELVDRHGDRLLRTAVGLVGNAVDAEDVVQETFVAAFVAAGKFRGESTGRAWLTGILYRQAAAWRRSKRVRRAVVLEMEPPTSGSVASTEARLDVRAALDRVSADHRDVLVLRELAGMSYDEIAAELKLPRGTVESRLFRARNELRAVLSGYREE